MALWATQRSVMWMVQKSALALVCAGLAVGAPLAFASKRVAASLFDGLPAAAAAPIAAAAAMIGVASVAAYVPARRAARVDPMEALRHE